MKKQLPYGTWPSAITTDLMVSSNIGLGEARLFDGRLYWLEFRPQENGRNVIVCHDGATTVDLIPKKYNCRSQVHEYGGASYLPTDRGVFFVNQSDQQIYRVANDGQIARLTDEANARFADLAWHSSLDCLIAIGETRNAKADEPENTLVAISLSDGTVSRLQRGADFYSSPAISADGKRLSWLSWDHPNMPWDGTQLWCADLLDSQHLSKTELVAGGVLESVFQPWWSPGGELYFVSDRNNWWNLYRQRNGEIQPVCSMDAEFGRPQWMFGITSYGFLEEGRIIAVVSENGSSRLLGVDTENGVVNEITGAHSSYDSLRVDGDSYCYIAQSPAAFAGLYCCDIQTGAEKLVRQSSSINMDAANFSNGQAISFKTGGDATAHGFFYAPAHPRIEGLTREKPPLLVMIHGGPTSATSNDLSLKIQFWTSRGFAVLDVNYRGSTGFGRAYRDALKNQWGVADVEDCDYGVRHLVQQGLVDPQRVAIRGGSAGGYTTLAALAMTDTFKAGASLYGVSDLTALAADTHKFESRYLDSLIGPYPQQKALYEERSPKNHADKIKCPVIFLQGLEDKIVPPNQAEIMIEALHQNGIPVAYLPFEGEQHGFRKAETIERAFEAELWFYGEIFGFDPADEIEPVAFVN